MQTRLWTLITLVLAASFAGCMDDEPDDGMDDPVVAPTAGQIHFADGVLAETIDQDLAIGGQYLTGHDATEPTLGITSDGTIFMTGFTNPPDDGPSLRSPTAVRSTDNGLTWEDVGPTVEESDTTPHATTNDPYLWVDPLTDRVYLDDLVAGYCTILSWSDDQGATWTTNPYACGGTKVNDHQTLVTAPPVSLPTVGYDNIMYLCFNNVATYDCTYSYDGGLTWTPQQPIDTGDDPEYTQEQGEDGGGCSALAGHLAASPDGVVYWPGLICSAGNSPPVVRVTEDDGLTWEKRIITEDPDFFTRSGDHDVSAAVDEAGNVHVNWISQAGKVLYTYSQDRGNTWSAPVDITAPGVTATEFNAIAAGGPGQVAFAYIGTTIEGGYEGKGEGNGGLGGDLFGQPYLPLWEGATWNAYIGFTTDAFADQPVYQSVSANDPSDPIARGLCGGTRCSGMNDFIDIRIDTEGRPWAAFVDVCTRSCILYDDEWSDESEGFVATLREGPSLRGIMDLTPIPAQPPQVDLEALAREPRTGPGRPAEIQGVGHRTWVMNGNFSSGNPAIDAAEDNSALLNEGGEIRFYREEANNILMELVWESETNDLDAVFFVDGGCAPDDQECDSRRAQQRQQDDGSPNDYYRHNTEGTPAEPDSPSTIEWTSESMDIFCEPACKLQPSVRSRFSTSEPVPYTIYVTAFDGAIPEGFSAVGSQ